MLYRAGICQRKAACIDGQSVAGATSFIPYVVMMYSDNIMVYVSYFGNFQFAILGMAYGSLAAMGRKTGERRKIRW